MCGRYRLSRKKQIIEEYFDSAPWDENWTPQFLKPYDAGSMRSYSVSSRINHVANDDEECSRPVAHVQNHPNLFA
jgi:putative SOS response-associated peptidase YedK